MVSALELKGELGSGQRELQRLGRSLAELRKQLAYGDLDLDAEQRRQIEARIADDAARLRELQQQHRTRLTAAQERHGEAMIARVEEVAREVAKREGLVLLLRNDGVLYEADEGLERVDITEAVARALLDRINPTEIPTPGSDS
jgi:Skp family chaperone for outer membrane proteins